ncbi:L-gulonolactone/D-arabinono-1,4-lactone oxidase [Russula earlei]|uniref:L-gulonolactone/D-arabinono-1,4-lactone oxidase n=1 Tax=Russula earlei TaxID=71964 RepID=A0ACC0UMT1_9AGAM|nr:L-gulonolactone/D-arabinono-1,4-lactone oxidase [Russula earlei]
MQRILSPLSDIALDDLYALLDPVTVDRSSAAAVFQNWSRTFRCTPSSAFRPETEHQVELILELARREGQTVRAVGVGHSPSDLACTSGYMIQMHRLDKIIEVNFEKRFVHAQGGVTLQHLHAVLEAHGLAMINLGSISEQTLAGMLTTATHGTGVDHRVLSTHVRALRLLLADGTKVTCSRNRYPDLFLATLCGLGSTGIILDVRMDVRPAFRLREEQETYKFPDVIDNFDLLAHSAEFVRLWWWPQADKVRVSTMDKTQEDKRPQRSWLWDSLVGYHLLQFLIFLGIFIPRLNIWIGQFSSWLFTDKTLSVDDSLNVFNIDCKYQQYTVEWALPYPQAQSCLRELRDWLQSEFTDPRGLRPHCILEIRFSDADDIWLSPSYGQKTCWIGIAQYKPYGFNVPYRALFQRFERIVIPYGGRPHWAKAHSLRPDALSVLYPRFDSFRKILNVVDPEGVFRNEYVSRHIFGATGARFRERVFKARS